MATLQELLLQAYGAPIPRDPYGNPIVAGPLPAPIIQGPTQPPRPGTGTPGGGTPGGGGAGVPGRGGQDWAAKYAARFGNVAGATYDPALNWGRNVSAAVHLRNAARRAAGGGDEEGDPGAAVNQMIGNVFSPNAGGGENVFSPDTGGQGGRVYNAHGNELDRGGLGVARQSGWRPAPAVPPAVTNLQRVAPRFMHTMRGLQRLKTMRGY